MGISVQSEIKKLSELITLYSDRLGLFQQSKILEVYSSWASIVGEKQAAHSQLIDIKHHTAVIETDHPGWSQQLRLNKRYIIRNFQKKYPQLHVQDISVIVAHYRKEQKHVASSEYCMNNHASKTASTDVRAMPHIKKADKAETASKAVLPAELQQAFEKLRVSIIENNKTK